MTEHHTEVGLDQPFYKGQNRYRLECGHSLDCACIHEIHTMVYCPACGIHKLCVQSAIDRSLPLD